MSLDLLTDRQKTARTRLTEDARKHGVEIRGDHDWLISYDEESRPGRGHNAHLTFCDGEHFAYTYLNVYGYGNGLSICRTDWLCNQADEENTCEPGVCPKDDDE